MSTFSSPKSADGLVREPFIFSASFNAAPVLTLYHKAFSAVLAVSGSGAPITGSMNVSGSHDGVNYFDVPNGSKSFVGNGTYFLPFDALAVRWVKLVFVRTGGSATTYATGSLCFI